MSKKTLDIYEIGTTIRFQIFIFLSYFLNFTARCSLISLVLGVTKMSKKSIGLSVGFVLASSLVFGPLSPLSASSISKSAVSPIPIGTAFSYQGQLRQNGLAANGVFALKFRLYDQLVEGTQVGSEVSEPASNVSGGSFSSELDFGNVFESKRWLEVEVDGTILTPRQVIMPTPTALFALSGNAGPQGLQ